VKAALKRHRLASVPELLNIRQAAKYFEVSETTVYGFVRSGQLAPIPERFPMLFRVADLEALQLRPTNR